MKIATIYPVIGIYRVPVFAELFRSARELGHVHEFHADAITAVDTVELADFPTVTDPQSPNHFEWHSDVRTHTWGKWLWQSGAIRIALRRDLDTLVFLGVCWHVSTWVAAVVGRLSGKRVIMWTHGFYGTESRSRMLFRGCFLKLANYLMFYGNHARNIAIEKGFDPHRMCTIYNSLDVCSQRAIRATITPAQTTGLRCKLFAHPECPTLIFIGRLIPEKKLDLILQAMHRLREEGRRINLVIIGTGPDEAALKLLAIELTLDNHVCFYGKCYKESEVAPLLAMSDICVTPGSIGLTCMHALVYGTPVITHNDPNTQGPEYEAVIPGVTGAFFEKGSVESLAHEIGSWLSDHPDKDVVRGACYAEVERRWTPEVMSHAINVAIGIAR